MDQPAEVRRSCPRKTGFVLKTCPRCQLLVRGHFLIQHQSQPRFEISSFVAAKARVQSAGHAHTPAFGFRDSRFRASFRHTGNIKRISGIGWPVDPVFSGFSEDLSGYTDKNGLS